MSEGVVDEAVVSDTSILVDLERGGLETIAFITRRLVVPDLLYESELLPHGGEKYLGMGLTVLGLNEAEVALALEVRRANVRLSLPDVFSLALAKSHGWLLITGDQALRDEAVARKVPCHGLLWLLDEAVKIHSKHVSEVHAGLLRLSKHQRCRLPRKEVAARLESYLAHMRK